MEMKIWGSVLGSYKSRVVRKPVLGVSNQVRHKSAVYSQKMAGSLKISFGKKRDCTICVAKTKALISCAVTAQLICTFVFSYAISMFSHDAAQIMQKVYLFAWLLTDFL